MRPAPSTAPPNPEAEAAAGVSTTSADGADTAACGGCLRMRGELNFDAAVCLEPTSGRACIMILPRVCCACVPSLGTCACRPPNCQEAAWAIFPSTCRVARPARCRRVAFRGALCGYREDNCLNKRGVVLLHVVSSCRDLRPAQLIEDLAGLLRLHFHKPLGHLLLSWQLAFRC